MKTSLKKQFKQQGFTLVELLVVMALIVLMASLAVPALNSVTKANSLTNGGNLVASLVEQARQHSMSANVMTALVLITGSNNGEGDYRAFTLLDYNAEDATPQWKQVAKWEYLPTGVVVDKNSPDCTFLSNSANPLPFTSSSDPVPPVNYHGQSVANYAARVFLPNGGLSNPISAAKIQLVEGVVQGGALVYTHPGSSGTAANYYRVAIIGATGRGKIERP